MSGRKNGGRRERSKQGIKKVRLWLRQSIEKIEIPCNSTAEIAPAKISSMSQSKSLPRWGHCDSVLVEIKKMVRSVNHLASTSSGK
jgi:hypothetical protein